MLPGTDPDAWAAQRLEQCKSLRSAGFRLLPLFGKVPPRDYPWRDDDGDFMARTLDVWRPDGWLHGANVGVQTGAAEQCVVIPSGSGGAFAEADRFFVVDLDGDEGEASWSRFCVSAGLDRTRSRVEVVTGRGRHLYFLGNPGRNGRVLPGVDIKAEGGYVVAAHSIHPNTRQPYRWGHGLSGRDAYVELVEWRIQEPDTALTDALVALPRTGFSFTGEAGEHGPSCPPDAFRAACLLETGLPEGHREHDFFWAVTAWLRADIEESEVWRRAHALHALSDSSVAPFEWRDAERRTRQAIDRHRAETRRRVEVEALTVWARGTGR